MTPNPDSIDTSSDVERIDAMIDMIISAYHTTRLRETPAALHIRQKLGERLIAAIAALSPSPVREETLEEAAKVAEAQEAADRAGVHENLLDNFRRGQLNASVRLAKSIRDLKTGSNGDG